MDDGRDPGQVPDELSTDVRAGFDTDGDGRPDTVLSDDGVDLIIAMDVDGDMFADRMLCIGVDGLVREVGMPDLVMDDGDREPEA
jgi:hypothetical protein